MLVKKMQALTTDVNGLFVGRGHEVECAVTALLANEHAVFIGDPGTAKSMVVDQISKRIGDAEYFWIQLFAETAPSDVFGQISLRALEQEDVNRRNTKGHLPSCHIGFLDEIFQARSSILVGCNSIMQERKYMAGCSKVDAPIRSLFGASNFFPEDEQLVALWDRFLLRRRVESLSTEEDIRAMLVAPEPPENPAPVITLAELDEAHKAAMSVLVGKDVLDGFMEVLAKMAALQQPINVSDRRKKKAWKLLRARAWLNGRTEVTTGEFPVLGYAFWSKPEDIAPIETILADYAPVEGDKVSAVVDALRPSIAKMTALRSAGNGMSQHRPAVMALLSNVNEVIADLKQYEARALTDLTTQKLLSDAKAMLRATQRDLYVDMGVDMDAFVAPTGRKS